MAKALVKVMPQSQQTLELAVFQSTAHLHMPEGVAGKTLAVHREDGYITSAWVADSWRERLKFLLGGPVFLSVHAGETQPPVSLYMAWDKTEALPADPEDPRHGDEPQPEPAVQHRVVTFDEMKTIMDEQRKVKNA